MSHHDHSERNQRAGLEASLEQYRVAACAEADAHFDERALETQRHKILARLAHIGHPAKVIRFPKARAAELPTGGVNRRWISIAAAAGLIIGLLGGQLVHLLPQPSRRPAASSTVATTTPKAPSPYVQVSSASVDDRLLDEIEVAMEVRSASALRALDAITPLPDGK